MSDPTAAFDAGTLDETASPIPGPTPERIGRFEVRQRLGEGAFGEVYAAHDPQLDRTVALKVARPGSLTTPARVQRFLREARAAANLRHPTIVPLFETGQDGERTYLASAYIPGGTLQAEMAAGPVPFGRAAAVVRKLAEALAYAHGQGVVHRDVKPANILLDDHREPMLADFGLAKRDEGPGSNEATREGDVLGTPAYMSPEQASGRSGEAGPASDQYALGVILYEMLTGCRPFTGDLHALLKAHVEQVPASPRSLNRAIPRDLETIALKCLEKDPAKRYATCDDLAEDLRRWLAGEPIRARRVGVVERTWRWVKRNPVGAGFVALLVATAVVTSLLSWQLFVLKEEADAARGREEAEKENVVAALGRAEAARQTTAEQRGIALETVRTVLRDVETRMRDDPRLASTRLTIVEAMLKNVNTIRDHALKNPLADLTEATTFNRLGLIYAEAGRYNEALPCFARSTELLAELARATPGDLAARRNLAAAAKKLAEVQDRLGQAEQARDQYRVALAEYRESVRLTEAAKPADETQVEFEKGNVGEVLEALAAMQVRLGEPRQAIATFLEADALYAELLRGSTILVKFHQARMDIQSRLADARARVGELDEAERLLRAALADREAYWQRVAGNPRPSLGARDAVAIARLFLGDFLMMYRRDRAKAAAEYGAALELALALHKERPGIDFQVRLAETYYRVGFSAATPEEAATAFNECLKLRTALAGIDPNDPVAQYGLALALARVGRIDEAERLAVKILDKGTDHRTILSQVLCVLSVASAKPDDPVAERCRNRAFNVLGELLRLGWKDRGFFDTDPDLDPLRKDPRFAAALAGRLPAAVALPPPPPEPVRDPLVDLERNSVLRRPLGNLRTAFVRKKGAPVKTELLLRLRYGNEESLRGQQLPAALLGPMLLRGSATASRQEITAAFARQQAKVTFTGSPGVLEVRIEAEREQLTAAVAFVADLLRRPAFPADEFEGLKNTNLGEAMTRRADSGARAGWHLSSRLAPWPRDDARHRLGLADWEADLRAVTLDQVVTLYQQIGPAAGELAVVGDCDPDAILAALEKGFAGWQGGVPYRPINRPAVPIAAEETARLPVPGAAALTYLAGTRRPVSSDDADYPATVLALYAFALDPIRSRFQVRLKEENLSVRPGVNVEGGLGDPAMFFQVYAYADRPADLRRFDAFVLRELTTFLEEGPTAEQLAQNKKNYLANLRLKVSQAPALLALLAEGLRFDRTLADEAELARKVVEVTPEQVRAAARKFFDPTQLVVIHAGNFKEPAAK